MKCRILLFLLTLLFATAVQAQNKAANTKAKNLIKASMEKMGNGWLSVQALSLEGYGYVNDIDQSERPEGPYIPARYSRSILKDMKTRRFLFSQKREDYNFNSDEDFLFNEGAEAQRTGKGLAPTLQGQQYHDELQLSPERVLGVALNAPDLEYKKDTIYQKTKHWIISFKFERYPVRVFLNQETGLLTAVEITKPYQNAYFGIWGDMKKTDVYSFWMLLGKGLHYPLQQDTYVNGYYNGSFLVNKWKVDPALNADTLRIPDSVKMQSIGLYKKQTDVLTKQVENGGKEIAPGIWLLRGPCNSTIISQPDGIIVIDASYSSAYGEALISKAKKLFPGKKIKALISTSDAWLHIGGARPFAAIPGMKIYHPFRNKFILQKLLGSSYKTEPDRLAKTAKPSYTLIGVSDTLAIGSGDNRLVLYAYRTETGDRQMMVYYPHHQLLYTSDHYQPKDSKGVFWNPEIVSEVYHSILDRKLAVKQFYAMHSRGLIPFEEMANDVKTGME